MTEFDEEEAEPTAQQFDDPEHETLARAGRAWPAVSACALSAQSAPSVVAMMTPLLPAEPDPTAKQLVPPVQVTPRREATPAGTVCEAQVAPPSVVAVMVATLPVHPKAQHSLVFEQATARR